MRLLTLALVLTVSGLGAEVAGRWSGDADVMHPGGEKQKTPVTLEFRRDANNEWTGTVESRGERTIRLTNIRVEDDQLSFVVQDDEVTFRFSGTVTGNELTGKGTGSTNNGTIQATFSLRRQQP